MDLTITQVMEMDKKTPDEVISERTSLACRVLSGGPALNRVVSTVLNLYERGYDTYSMSFINSILRLGKQVELWARNVHKRYSGALVLTTSAQEILN
jgi:hypothetical protein